MGYRTLQSFHYAAAEMCPKLDSEGNTAQRLYFNSEPPSRCPLPPRSHTMMACLSARLSMSMPSSRLYQAGSTQPPRAWVGGVRAEGGPCGAAWRARCLALHPFVSPGSPLPCSICSGASNSRSSTRTKPLVVWWCVSSDAPFPLFQAPEAGAGR